MNKPFLAAVVAALVLGTAGTRGAEHPPRQDWATMSASAAAPAPAPAPKAEPIPAPSDSRTPATLPAAPVPAPPFEVGHGPVPGPVEGPPGPDGHAGCATCCHGPGSCWEHLWAWITYHGNRTDCFHGACCGGGCHCHSCDGYHCFPPLYLYFLHPCVEGYGACCTDGGHAGH